MQASGVAGRSNQSLSACPISFDTQSGLINPTLDGNNLTVSISALTALHSVGIKGSEKQASVEGFVTPTVTNQHHLPETCHPAMSYFNISTPVHVRLQVIEQQDERLILFAC